MQQYDTVVLSGGSVRGYALLGAMQYLYDNDKLRNIRKYIGTSIGSIIGYFLCIGYSPTEILLEFSMHKISEKVAERIDILNIINGTLKFHILQDFLEKCTRKKIKHYLTLKELFEKFGKELICCTYNMTLHKPEYLNYQTHPNMNCITALRMSASVPFLFEPYEYEGYKYMDGGLCDNFPISQVKSEDCVLACRLRSLLRNIENNENLLQQMVSIFHIPMHRIEELHCNNSKENIDIIVIDVPVQISFHFYTKITTLLDIFSIGYHTTQLFFNPAMV